MNITITEADAESQALEYTNAAIATILNVTSYYKGLSYADVQTSIGFESTTELIDYVYYSNIMELDSDDTPLLVNMGVATIKLEGNSGKGYTF
jgi:hypothetical protein